MSAYKVLLEYNDLIPHPLGTVEDGFPPRKKVESIVFVDPMLSRIDPMDEAQALKEAANCAIRRVVGKSFDKITWLVEILSIEKISTRAFVSVCDEVEDMLMKEKEE